MPDNPTWIDDYVQGATLDEVGESEGVTREAIRRRILRLGIPVRSAEATRRMQHQRFAEVHGAEAKRAFLELRDIAKVAAELAVPAPVVQHFIETNVPDHTILTRVPRNYAKRYSDDELLEFLRLAADGLDVPLTGDVYEERITQVWPAADSRRPPTKQAFALKFESWRGALQRAGLPANPTTQVPKTYEDPAVAVSAIVELWQELGRPPTVRDYDSWDSSERGYPSSALICRLVESWNTGLVKAWQIVHGIPLAQDEVDVAVPPNALESIQYPTYVQANESIAVVGEVKVLDDYAKLERALRGHAHLQNRVAEELTSIGHAPVSPSPAPPMFDIAFHLPKSVVVVEIKSATAANLEMQLRIGVGQILWYAHEMRLRHESVHAALAVEIPPSERWRSLLQELDIYLVTLPEVAADVVDLVGWAKLRDAAESGP